MTRPDALLHSKDVEKSINIDNDAVLAKVIALAARNGVEDLHAAGAFSDQQAPSLNRRLRGRVYELLIATRHRDSSQRHDPFTAYVDDLAHGYTGSHITAALQGAIAQAVDKLLPPRPSIQTPPGNCERQRSRARWSHTRRWVE